MILERPIISEMTSDIYDQHYFNAALHFLFDHYSSMFNGFYVRFGWGGYFSWKEEITRWIDMQIGIHYGGVFYEFVPWNGVLTWEISPWGRWCISAENGTHKVIHIFFTCQYFLGTSFSFARIGVEVTWIYLTRNFIRLGGIGSNNTRPWHNIACSHCRGWLQSSLQGHLFCWPEAAIVGKAL